MSGGEQQRTAIAVALANSPSVILADEPTGELDSATADQVFDAFRTANEELGTTVVVVTHDLAVASAVREYATVDRSGRLQLPRDFTEALDIRERVLLELEPDHIAVRPERHAPDD
jgi:ABC-type lipoprotein export system ATPase subunit